MMDEGSSSKLKEPLMGQQAKEDKHAAKDEGQSPKVPSAAPPPAPPVEDDATTRRASKAAAQAAFLHRLGSRLWKVGVLLRMLTLLNGVAVLFAVSYAIWRDVIPESHNDAAFDWPLMSRLNDGVPPEVSSYLPHNATLRNALRFGTAAAVGLAMIVLEMCTAVAEAATRSAIGLAFGATGRFWLFCVFALLCAPMIDLEDSLLDSYISAGAVAITLLSGLLQGLLLCCFPNYRHFCVAELVKPRLLMDATAFPQIYQRDDGGRLHLGVLLPGFEDRNNLIMTVNTSEVELVGEIRKLQAPLGSPVDSTNSVAGPFGPFSRKVKLEHPVDCSRGVESLMKYGIVEFRFQKGLAPEAAVADAKV